MNLIKKGVILISLLSLLQGCFIERFSIVNIETGKKDAVKVNSDDPTIDELINEGLDNGGGTDDNSG